MFPFFLASSASACLSRPEPVHHTGIALSFPSGRGGLSGSGAALRLRVRGISVTAYHRLRGLDPNTKKVYALGQTLLASSRDRSRPRRSAHSGLFDRETSTAAGEPTRVSIGDRVGPILESIRSPPAGGRFRSRSL
jgi:hypothetical protein